VLAVDVNSSERAAELRMLVGDALPDAEVVDVDVHPYEMPDQPVRPSGRTSVDRDDPETRAALAEYVAGYERRWLDQRPDDGRIPADGRPDRQRGDAGKEGSDLPGVQAVVASGRTSTSKASPT